MKTNVIIEINFKNNKITILGKNKKSINFFKNKQNKLIEGIKSLKNFSPIKIISEKIVLEYNIFNNKFKVISDEFLFADNPKIYIKQDSDSCFSF